MKHKTSFVVGSVALLSGLTAVAFSIYAAKILSDVLEKSDSIWLDPLDDENEF